MVHPIQQDRSCRKRDRRTAGLPPLEAPGESSDLTMTGTIGHETPLGEIQPSLPKAARLGMYDTYQPWVLQTYGDQAKTKTITRNKFHRILQILRGEFIDNESSKFKLWVKGRGFRIGPPPGYYQLPMTENNAVQRIIDYSPNKDAYPDIYVQTGTVKVNEIYSIVYNRFKRIIHA